MCGEESMGGGGCCEGLFKTWWEGLFFQKNVFFFSKKRIHPLVDALQHALAGEAAAGRSGRRAHDANVAGVRVCAELAVACRARLDALLAQTSKRR